MLKIWTSLAYVLYILVILIEDTLGQQQFPPTGTATVRREKQKVFLDKFRSRTTYQTYKMTTATSTTVQRGDQTPLDDDDDVNIGDTIQDFFLIDAYRPPLKVHPCEQSSCYPATGNLLIGREQRLYASSTCGVYGPERYCIVSHLEKKKCFLCDTREATKSDSLKNHRVGQIIYKTKPGTREQTWWQSENGVENVTIQLDLEAEFHFTHLIMISGTFRPASMLIERSYDFGHTWHVYRYFAHNCHEAFGHVPTIPRNVTDVVCDSRYSGVEPSKNGEIIFRVLPPNMRIEDPYADHIQNMLKMTNLRVNFTKLHTLGDTHLDHRNEIQEKYYYAILNMVVRGSCSCYGHASRCLPLDGVENTYDMVHGRCECTHNTKGLNCEDCEDFYNDLPWKPAFGKKTNACRKCNCNNHATSCHYDQAVFEHTGKISGGVCDNCQHNTQGQHCEECIPFFYKDPHEDIQSPYVCRSCDCDPRGSLGDGICDSVTDEDNNIEAGACHCKQNVKGRRCDICKDGFWKLDVHNTLGCQNCTCNILGTINNSGCNMYTGECTCKRFVTEKDCNKCLPETYGLSDSSDGCSLCACDPGGALDNHCDVVTGQCTCRSHMTGRTCNTPNQNHFIPSLHAIIEAENPLITACDSHSSFGNCTIIVKEPQYNRPNTWTGTGLLRAYEGSTITLTTRNISKTLPYDVVVRYESHTPGDWESAIVTIVRPDEYDPDGLCANSHPFYETDKPFRLPERRTSTIALNEVCLEQGKVYKIRITFERHRNEEENPVAQIFVDSVVLVPRIEVTTFLSGSGPAEQRLREYIELGCNDTYYQVDYETNTRQECKDLMNTISILVYDGAIPCNCNATGSLSKKCEEFGGNCQCKTNVVGRQCNLCAPGNYGFSPEGCKACDCNSIGAKDNDCDLITGQCKCQPNTYGRECNKCQNGFWNFPNCQICECNGHAIQCNATTGQCIACQDYTTGYRCERCVESYYGNPELGSSIGCRPCRCPDTVASGHSHTNICRLDQRTKDMICYCPEGYAGARCDICTDNYYGNPEVPGGVCRECNCNNNIDLSRPGNCDSKTGACLECLYETGGEHCEHCKEGYYGDALRQNCRQCDCDVLGTNSTLIRNCDRYTGQCKCLKNVIGPRCDRCEAEHWKIASGEGCERCDCDSHGSENNQCNPYDGQCECRSGFGGRQCDQCQSYFWGNPNVQCQDCNCNPYGSAKDQCDRRTGQCVCNTGIGGYKCEICARGYLGEAPYCSPCGECFDNWDLILSSLQNDTIRMIDEAKNIKTIGATGAYTKEFEGMQKKIDTVKALLNNATVSPEEIQEISLLQQALRKDWNSSLLTLQNADKKLENVYSDISLAGAQLEGLKNKSMTIKTITNDLKKNGTTLQEANVEGALNLTRAAWDRVSILSNVKQEIDDLNDKAERQCKRTEKLLQERIDDLSDTRTANDLLLDHFEVELSKLSANTPELNNQMCDRRGNPCDDLCGGAGCSTCGGLSCENGAYSKADKALEYAKNTEQNIKEKEEIAENLIRSLSQVKANASKAFKSAENVYLNAQSHHNETSGQITKGLQYINDLIDATHNNTASPESIRAIAESTLALDLNLEPEEIKNLAANIDVTVASLKNVDQIIANTTNDLRMVEELKIQANETKIKADKVLETANIVFDSINEAEEAQKKAGEAIKKANSDINTAKIDLETIHIETVEAQKRANDTASKVDQLKNRLNTLQTNILKNDLSAKEIKNEAEIVKEDANNAHEIATQLRNKYKKANETLGIRAKNSESARERAQMLLVRASTITVNTNEKLQLLQEMVNNNDKNDKELEKLEDKLHYLNEIMNDYLKKIQEHADEYRHCSS